MKTGAKMKSGAKVWASPKARKRLKGRVPREDRTKLIIDSAWIDNGNLVLGDRKFRVRDIQSVELRHDVEGTAADLVDVFIGFTDLSRRPMFARVAVGRTFAGVADVNGEAAEFLRTDLRDHGVPVIEF